jgi:hypothetical protein
MARWTEMKMVRVYWPSMADGLLKVIARRRLFRS